MRPRLSSLYVTSVVEDKHVVQRAFFRKKMTVYKFKLSWHEISHQIESETVRNKSDKFYILVIWLFIFQTIVYHTKKGQI